MMMMMMASVTLGGGSIIYENFFSSVRALGWVCLLGRVWVGE